MRLFLKKIGVEQVVVGAFKKRCKMVSKEGLKEFSNLVNEYKEKLTSLECEVYKHLNVR